MSKKSKATKALKEMPREPLPAWVTFPDAPPVYEIVDNGEAFVIVGVEDKTFEFPSEAYDYISDELKGESTFAPNALSRKGSGSHGMFFEKGLKSAGGGNRLLLAHTQQTTVEYLESDYADFLKLNKKYQKNSDKWELAYHWVRTHPAFWHRHKIDTPHWDFENGWDSKWETVYRHKGKTVVMLEHGPWLEEDGEVLPSVDHDLDARAATFEEAFVKFAKNVNKHYGLDGLKKPTKKEKKEAKKVQDYTGPNVAKKLI